ncbi:FAH family protein [Bordetella bronchiseptica MBORD635]|uniref:fumarylacetoacetate hydrolase family protein n=1 Tax=Bordetella bronchiseptica TaxID=518 RepID=UPI00046165E5|nr:fumarylacetoacetate hydrolase family protein [Bordetella bronchiseptica]KDC78903.1 FAH family protein [Bordetella bronchiseptica MBORD635]
MKYLSFELPDGRRRVGALASPDTIVDLTAAMDLPDLLTLVRRHGQLAGDIAQRVAQARHTVALSTVRVLAPLPNPPRNVFCVGKNYHEHAREFAQSGFDSSAAAGAIPAAPIIFSKPASSISGPGDAIDSALDPCDSVDYEAELAVVIGKAGRVAAGDDPWSFVFGYTLVNDVTSRGLQKRHSQWLLGKGIDGFCPMGPTLVTADEIDDIGALRIACEVNGEPRQSARLSDLIFDIPTLVRAIGASITLQPGDIIATGTPVGVGIGFTPPRYLRPGDVVRVRAEPIGVLENPVI